MVPCYMLHPVVFPNSTMGYIEVDFGWLHRLPIVFLPFPATPLLRVGMVAGVFAVMLRCPSWKIPGAWWSFLGWTPLGRTLSSGPFPYSLWVGVLCSLVLLTPDPRLSSVGLASLGGKPPPCD